MVFLYKFLIRILFRNIIYGCILWLFCKNVKIDSCNVFLVCDMINVFFFKVVKFVLEVIKFLVRKMDEEF